MKNDSQTDEKTTMSLLEIYGGDQRISRIFFGFTFSIFVALLVELVILQIINDRFQEILVVSILPFLMVGYYYSYKKQFEKSAIFLAIVMFSTVTILSTFGLGIHHLSNLSFPAILIVASLVVGKRSLIILNLFAMGCVAWLVFGEIFHLYTPHVLQTSVPGDFFTTVIILTVTSIMARLLTQALFESTQENRRELLERHRIEERLEYDALHDALTGLPNRSLFNDRLAQKLERTRRNPEAVFAVLFLDLDRFKIINDSLGHAVGDQVLITTAQRLGRCVRPDDTVSRLGGDEFAILLDDFNDVSDVLRVAERIQDQLGSTSMLENVNRITTASIGIAIFNQHYNQAQEILRDADSAMYHAKMMGGGQFAVFDESMYANALSLLQMETDLKRAVENHEWLVYYQPIISLPERKIVGAEALVRWNHPQRGLTNPSEFIHIAEDTGLILSIGEFVLREACRQVVAWRRQGYPDLWVSVNLSARQFQDQNLPPTIEKILSETGCPGDGLHIEITESVAMKDFSYSSKILNYLSGLGIQISLDDFGIAYSSLSYLSRFPIKILKIDRWFIMELLEKQNNEAIIIAIVSMSHALNLEVIAEGVETERQIHFLQSIGCDKIQGHVFSSALTAEGFENRL